MPSLAVVIAAYDERSNIEPLTRRLHGTLATLSGWDWRIIYVIAGRDGTRGLAERLASELGRIQVLYEEQPGGLGSAFRLGFAAASDADAVVTLDADLNHQPEEIPQLLAAIQAGTSDIVIGSRFLAASSVDGTPAWKRALSGSMNLLMGRLFGVRVRDKTSGFRAYRGEVLRRLAFKNNNFAFLPEILIRAHAAGYRMVEVPIHFVFRRHGQSKLRFWQTSISYIRLLAGRWHTRLHRGTPPGEATSGLSIDTQPRSSPLDSDRTRTAPEGTAGHE